MKRQSKGKIRSILISVCVLIVGMLISFQACYIWLGNRYKHELNELKTSAQISFSQKLNEIDEIYRENYIGELDYDKIEKSAVYGYLLGTGDKYTEYMTADEYKEFNRDLSGDLVGIGIMVVSNPTLDSIQISSVNPGSPAEKAGLLPGDMIVEVDGEAVAEIGYLAAVDMVRGEVGTKVDLVIERRGENIPMSVIREKVTSVSVLSHMFENENDHIGIVKVIEFDYTTPVQFRDAVNSLIDQGAKAFIFDMRDNPGGELSSVVNVLDMILPEGPIIRIIDAEGNETSIDSDAQSELVCPMAVLVNGSTASAAELFSSSLRDYEKAKLIGEHTYGKGCMQEIMMLSDGSALRITRKMYCSAKAENFDGIGLTPDIEIKLSEDAAAINPYLIKDTDDNQLIAAVIQLKEELTENKKEK